MTRQVRRRRVLQGIGGATALGLAGCLGGDKNGGGGGGTNRTIKQGVLQPLSGDLGDLGKPIKDAAILPFTTTETDFTLDKKVADTQTNPNAGQTAATSLVDAGYPAVTGAASSEVTIQVAKEVFIPNGVVGCSPASTSPAITDLKDNNLIWRTPPTDALQGKVLAQIAKEREDATTAATLYVNNSYGQLLSKSFSSAFKNTGGSIQTQVSFQKEQSSYSSPLSQALGGDPDVLVVIGYPASGKQLFRDFYSDTDGSTPILITDGLKSASLPSDVGNAMSNVKGTAPLAAGPGKDFFTSKFKSEYGSEPGVFTSQAFDATAVCLLANAAAGKNVGAKIAEKMQAVANPGGETITPKTLGDGLKKAANGTEIQYKGASSAVDFDSNGDLKAATYELFGFKKGGGIKSIDEIKFSA
ncbi:MAG: ABC transporter substrate-binding protein [Halorientalis sp.]